MRGEVLVAGGAEAVVGFAAVEGGALGTESGVFVGFEVWLNVH